MNDKKLLIINIILLAIVALTVFYTVKSATSPSVRKVEKTAKAPEAASSVQTSYNIHDVKPPVVKTSGVRSLKDAYANFPKKDVGDDMIEGWSRVDPKDKAKLIETLDEQIVRAREALNADPNDKRAKGMLRVSEGLKRMTSQDFNYVLKAPGSSRTIAKPDPGKTTE